MQRKFQLLDLLLASNDIIRNRKEIIWLYHGPKSNRR